MAVNLTDPSFLVYGPQGSGLHTCLKAFRELGYLTVSGLPLTSLQDYPVVAQPENTLVALTPDIVPDRVTPQAAVSTFSAFKQAHPAFKLLYLSTPTEVLMQRYTAMEKKHPYDQHGLREAIEAEQLIYRALKPLSDYHIDTSTTSDHELGLKVAKILGRKMGTQPLSVTLTSFGFKNGMPTDADMVFDMRFLPNPFYEAALKPMTGLDRPVLDYLTQFPETTAFLTQWQTLIAQMLPLYQSQGKTRLHLAIGCTGGQHRSVAMTMALARFLEAAFPQVAVKVLHREQQHWPQHTPVTPC